MATRNVVLTTEQDDFVTRLVESGRYQNASEAMRAGLRLLEREEAEIAEIRANLMESLRQARAGEFADEDGETTIRRVFDTVLRGRG